MAITFPTIPVLIDKFIVDFNAQAIVIFPWLNNPLGKLQELTKHFDGKYIKVPAMFNDGNEYMEIFPDDTLVNYSWFQFSDIEPGERFRAAKVKATASFNLFVDLRTIYPNVTSRNTENLKLEILQGLKQISLKTAAFRVISISEKYEDVYKGFKLNETESKYFMQPYSGLNFKLDIYLKKLNCN